MRNIRTSAATVVLILTLTVPVEATGRLSHSTFFQALKRFVVRAMSRVSPPVGSPALAPEEPTMTTTTTTDEPTTSQ